jgi:hypothetical protein
MSEAKSGYFRFAAVIAVLALVAAACSKGSSVSAAGSAQPSAGESGSTMPSASMSGSQMMMQPGADKMHVRILSPSPGFILTGNTLDLKVKTSGYTDSCAYAGKPDREGFGHYHVLLDGSLINMFCAPTAQISMQNVSPGQHMVEVVPAQNDHTEIMENAQEIPFTYQPSNPLQQITTPGGTGQPAIKILEPKDGATLSGTFTVKVAFTNFTPSCGLMGKPDVSGYGHWHVNIDSMSGPMMGMGTMLGMSCTDTFTASTVGLQAGSTHTLFALLADNGHAPIGVFDHIQFTVGQ